jgi:hypothetical protein
MLDKKTEQVIINFLVKVKKTTTEMFNLLNEVYGENTLSRAHVSEWCKRLSEGRQAVEDDE